MKKKPSETFLAMPQSKKKAIIYDITTDSDDLDVFEKRIHETERLLQTYGAEVKLKILHRRAHRASRSFIGFATLENLLGQAKRLGANLLVLGDSVIPRQIYAVEHYIEEFCRIEKSIPKIEVWDRIGLIIRIFKQHAKTAEAKLQTDLASLRYFGPRIYGMGDELSQQAGGIGTRGLGETNTEIMKRHLAGRKKRILQKIEQLSKAKAMQRSKRSSAVMKNIALIGYTNAGKSMLFSALTKRPALIENKLFATLDSYTHKVYLPKICRNILLSDTIGFIENLPPSLLDAFRSTLEETIQADLLLHVVDLSSEYFMKEIHAVNETLSQLSLDNKPRLIVFNKMDALNKNDLLVNEHVKNALSGNDCVFISAKKQQNLDKLTSSIVDILYGARLSPRLKLVPSLQQA